jgi:hypothetical protein
LKRYYSDEFLERLGCGLEKNYNWAHRLVHNTRRSQHPLEHLLLMHFLGVTAREFFRLPARRLPYGEGPWPCLNLAADHFGEALVTEYGLVATTRRFPMPRGIFRCRACGFAYCRSGPDNSPGARFTAERVIASTPAWVNALRKLYREGRGRDELARHFHLTPEALSEQLTRLGKSTLPGATHRDRRKTSADSDKKGSRLKTPRHPERREENRKSFLRMIEENPGLGRSALRLKDTSVYDWLYDYDRAWLDAHLPPHKHSKGPGVTINWADRDAETAKTVREEAARMRSAPGRPVRVTKTGLAKKIGQLAVVSKRGNLMPSTVRALSEVSESIEDYAARRVRWAAECYRAEGLCPSTWQLQIRAAVSNKVAKHPAVRAAMEAAVESLDPQHFSARGRGTGFVADFIIPGAAASSGTGG